MRALSAGRGVFVLRRLGEAIPFHVLSLPDCNARRCAKGAADVDEVRYAPKGVYGMKHECKTCPYAAKCATFAGPTYMFWDMIQRETNKEMESVDTENKVYDVVVALRNMIASAITVETTSMLRGKLPVHCELHAFVEKHGRPRV
jgi:hypothetical protein